MLVLLLFFQDYQGQLLKVISRASVRSLNTFVLEKNKDNNKAEVRKASLCNLYVNNFFSVKISSTDSKVSIITSPAGNYSSLAFI